MMRKSRSKKSIRTLLPWFLNGTLDRGEHNRVKVLSANDDQTRFELEGWTRLQYTIRNQPHHHPPAEIWRCISQRLGDSHPGKTLAPEWLVWSAGIAFSVLAIFLLWNSFRPGVGIRWTVQGSLPSLFRVYRAPVGTHAFKIIETVQAKHDTNEYLVFDDWIIPGRVYDYRVEGIGLRGEVTVSQSTFNKSSELLFNQLVILIIGLLCGYSIVLTLHLLPFRLDIGKRGHSLMYG